MANGAARGGCGAPVEPVTHAHGVQMVPLRSALKEMVVRVLMLEGVTPEEI